MPLHSVLKKCVQQLLEPDNPDEKCYEQFLEFIAPGITNEALAEIKNLIEVKSDTAVAMLLQGIIYYYRDENYDLAVEIFEEAKAKGSLRAEFWVGYVYNNPDFVNYNQEIARQNFQRAASKGDIFARLNLVDMGNDRDTEESRQVFKEAIRKGAFVGYIDLMNSYVRTGEYDKVLELCEQALNIKEPAPLFVSAAAFLYGDYGIPTNASKGLAYLQKAAECNWPPALHELGLIYQYGKCGVAVDGYKAITIFQKLLELGSSLPLVSMARLHAEAACCPSPDYDTFYQYSMLAIQNKAHDRSLAYCNLGMLYFLGLGETVKDLTRAMQNFGRCLTLLEKSNREPSFDPLKKILNCAVVKEDRALIFRCLNVAKKWAIKGSVRFLDFLATFYQDRLDLINDDSIKKLLKPEASIESFLAQWQLKFPNLNFKPPVSGPLPLRLECTFLQKLEIYFSQPVNFNDLNSDEYSFVSQTKFIKKHFRENLNLWLTVASYLKLYSFVKDGLVEKFTPEEKGLYQDIVLNAQGAGVLLQKMVALTADEDFKEVINKIDFSIESKIELPMYKSLDSQGIKSTTSSQPVPMLELPVEELSLQNKPDPNRNTPSSKKKFQPG